MLSSGGNGYQRNSYTLIGSEKVGLAENLPDPDFRLTLYFDLHLLFVGVDVVKTHWCWTRFLFESLNKLLYA